MKAETYRYVNPTTGSRKSCGDCGGRKADGTPCTRKIGWGTDHSGEGPCRDHEGSGEVLALRGDVVKKPQNWDKAVAAAYLWLITDNLKTSAKEVGIGHRTLKRWKGSPWWYDACEQASERWLKAGKGEARRGLLKAIKAGDTASQRWLLERTDMRLAPPAQQHEIFIDYLHRTDVVELVKGIASDMMEVVEDPELRKAIAECFQRRLEKHTGNSRGGAQRQLPPGNTEGGEV